MLALPISWLCFAAIPPLESGEADRQTAIWHLHHSGLCRATHTIHFGSFENSVIPFAFSASWRTPRSEWTQHLAVNDLYRCSGRYRKRKFFRPIRRQGKHGMTPQATRREAMSGGIPKPEVHRAERRRHPHAVPSKKRRSAYDAQHLYHQIASNKPDSRHPQHPANL